MPGDIDSLLSRLYHPQLKEIDMGLGRVESFLDMLGSPHKRLPPVIHVAGTNGKGSLIAYLQAIFEAAGYRVHRYTSPHLVSFNERIVIAGKPVSDAYLKHLLETILGYVAKQPATFFESTTAMAFLAFTEHPADIVLLETGMGGRLDATNMIARPLLTAITPVSLDHCSFLGNSVAEIAGEKAGIIKQDVPCVVGRQENDAANVITRKAESLNAPLYRFGHEWQVMWDNNKATYQSAKRTIQLHPALAGMHQYYNAANAVACIDMINSFSISEQNIRQGLEQAVWPARLQHLRNGRYASMLPAGMELWLDGGHNPDGAKALVQWFTERGVKEVHIICGMIKSKDEREFMRIMAPHLTRLYAVTIPEEPLSIPAQQLEMAAGAAGIRAESSVTIEKALQSVAAHAKTPAIVCICGSLYLAGQVLATN